MKKNNRLEVSLFILLVGILITLEVFCARLAFETLGEVTSLMYYMALSLNLIFVLLALRNRTLAILGIIILALAIIPYQLFLGNRLLRTQAEASRIVTYVYEEKITTGDYPPTLANYKFQDPNVERFIQSYQVKADSSGFSLFYRVGTENTSHSYISQVGWGYYPD
jgi:hypothetical protein